MDVNRYIWHPKRIRKMVGTPDNEVLKIQKIQENLQCRRLNGINWRNAGNKTRLKRIMEEKWRKLKFSNPTKHAEQYNQTNRYLLKWDKIWKVTENNRAKIGENQGTWSNNVNTHASQKKGIFAKYLANSVKMSLNY